MIKFPRSSGDRSENLAAVSKWEQGEKTSFTAFGTHFPSRVCEQPMLGTEESRGQVMKLENQG